MSRMESPRVRFEDHAKHSKMGCWTEQRDNLISGPCKAKRC
jgi:hypothetical protein